MVVVVVVVVSYGLEPSGLYRHRRGLGLHRVSYNGRRSTYPYRQACLPRQGKSHPDTGRSLQSCIFIVLESGWRYSPATRTPPNPGLPHSLITPPSRHTFNPPVLLLQEFDLHITDRKGAENLVVDNLSRLENVLDDPLPIDDSFPHEQLATINVANSTPWYAHYDNYIVAKYLPPSFTYQQKKKILLWFKTLLLGWPTSL